MRPDIIGACAIRLAIAGIEHVHKIHASVVVVVVQREVHLIINSLTRLFDHHINIGVVVLRIVLAVILIVLRQRNRSYYVEHGVILPERAVMEILLCTAFGFNYRTPTLCVVSRILAGIVLSVEHRIHLCHGRGELLIGKTNQNNQSAWCEIDFRAEHLLAVCVSRVIHSEFLQFIGRRHRRGVIKARVVTLKHGAFGIGVIVKERVTVQVRRYLCTIGLGQSDSISACRFGGQRQGKQAKSQ